VGSRREYNRESLELWLLTYGREVSTSSKAHPDEYHGKTGKPASRPAQNLTWLEAITDPQVMRSRGVIAWAVLYDLPRREPEYYDALRRVYLDEYSDPALPEFERRAGDDTLGITVAKALSDVLDRIAAVTNDMILVVPEPEQAEGYVEKGRHKKRVALVKYHTLIDQGEDPAEARRQAARHAKVSIRSVQYWTRNPKTQV
jgi:hypothetical protein